MFGKPKKEFSSFDIDGSMSRKHISKYNQQDETLHNLFISVKCSTCFRGFLRPSSGAQKLYIQHRVLCQNLFSACFIVPDWKYICEAWTHERQIH